ncbi:MAG: glucose 1-dehydrogenase, partial [Acidobacteria bacterium]|nr:glucose 1-dehydrogenase [Acidobacteriota bacterium]
FDLTGKTAVVTGASYGLGVTFAEALAEQGAQLVLAARSEAKLNDFCARLSAAGHNAVAVKCDVADSAQVKRLMEAAMSRFGRIDVLVNNAGVVAEAGMMPERVPDDVFASTVQVNLMGLWYCCRHAAHCMLADGKGGSIINNASVAGLVGMGNFPPAYQATKAAVIHLTRNLACSWADRGVRVNALAPGWFPSEMTGPAFAAPGFLDWAARSAPMGRIGRPPELTPALIFLASQASSFITGQVLAVDGGLSASSGCWPESARSFFETAGLGDLARRIQPAEQQSSATGHSED